MDDELRERLQRIDERLEMLLKQQQHQQPPREWYSVAEYAEIMERSQYTVRQWCLEKRIDASKTDCGRGGKTEWRIRASEVQRVRDLGLLPPLYKRPIKKECG